MQLYGWLFWCSEAWTRWFGSFVFLFSFFSTPWSLSTFSSHGMWMCWDFLGHLGALEVLPSVPAGTGRKCQAAPPSSRLPGVVPKDDRMSHLSQCKQPPWCHSSRVLLSALGCAAKSSPGHSSGQIYSTPPKEKTKTKKPTPSWQYPRRAAAFTPSHQPGKVERSVRMLHLGRCHSLWKSSL